MKNPLPISKPKSISVLLVFAPKWQLLTTRYLKLFKSNITYQNKSSAGISQISDTSFFCESKLSTGKNDYFELLAFSFNEIH